MKDKNYEILKNNKFDGSLVEKVGSVETIYRPPHIPWWVELEEITYSQTLYDSDGDEGLFDIGDKVKGIDPYYDTKNMERFRGKGKSELSRVSFFGEKGGRDYDITIIPIQEGDQMKPRVYLDVFKNTDPHLIETSTHSLQVHIKQKVFDDLKEIFLQNNLKVLKLSFNFTESKDIYHDQNLDSDIVIWKILNKSDESCKTIEGKIRRLDFTSYPQSLPGFKSGEKY